MRGFCSETEISYEKCEICDSFKNLGKMAEIFNLSTWKRKYISSSTCRPTTNLRISSKMLPKIGEQEEEKNFSENGNRGKVKLFKIKSAHYPAASKTIDRERKIMQIFL